MRNSRVRDRMETGYGNRDLDTDLRTLVHRTEWQAKTVSHMHLGTGNEGPVRPEIQVKPDGPIPRRGRC